MKVALVGATGYSGLELLRLLHAHPFVSDVNLYSNTASENQNLIEIYPHLQNIQDKTIAVFHAEELMAQNDVVFLATPSGISMELATPFIEAKYPVIDLSGDFRLKQGKVYEKWYHQQAASETYLRQAEYGLAEFRTKPTATLVANPGCYATATLLALAPLIQEDWLQEDSIIVDGKSGISGAGKKISSATHFSETNENMSMYKINQHQHIPEIIQQMQQWNKGIQAIQFSTSLIPITRGIFITAYAKPKKELTVEKLQQLYETNYQQNEFVRVQPQGVYPTIKQVVGSNYCDLGLTYNEVTKTIMIISVIDNLVKGAAGQAIQNLNIMQGFPETAGLDFVPLYP